MGAETKRSKVSRDAEMPEERIEPVDTPWSGKGVVTLISTQNEFALRAFNCSPARDREVHAGGGRSWRFTIREGGGTAILRWQRPREDPQRFEGLTGFGVSLFVAEPDKVTDFGLWAFTGNGGRFRWSSENVPSSALRRGWNHLRFSGNWMQAPLEHPVWGEVSALQVYVHANAATTFNLGRVWAETRPKASLLFIHDGGYAGFDQSPGYQDLLDRGIPVTWAVDCALIGDADHVTLDRLIDIGNENDNLISFHGWDGAISNQYTVAGEAREETAKCQQWIRRLPTSGRTGWRWRAAWMQNRSPFSPATDDMVELNPMWDPTREPPRGATMWPLTQPYNYRREALHHLSSRDLRELFQGAKETHGVLICYTHNVGEGITHIPPSLWAEFLELVDEGVSAGWLEGVTFEMLDTPEDR